ncbi:hypothetical protein BKK49_10130 [Rodentibacter rarus]|uniref:Uncharacterized protein n=1 Tax=Rodentibacter rarus TaxID=1908260 RepID=A0A1V3IR82_9PAST|nr:hypothetical protein [Rodentibacter rarus]OOF38243.1 hypothetical protein BKK49_10130 [Rodentibacter rarus]OOF44621.1 hypothetical protein BKK50_02115 [Rodentibacter rarus]
MIPTALLPSALKIASNTLDTKNAYQQLLDCYKQCQNVKQRERTNREEIRSDRDVNLARIKAQKDILELYLKETFSERRTILNEMFKALDKGLETGDLQIINMSLGGILHIAEKSPLTQARQMLEDVKNPDKKSIDW